MDMVRVNNKRPTILHLPDNLRAEGDEKNLRMIGIGTGKSLQPGGNNVDRAEWERAKQHKEVASWLKLGWLEEGGNTDQPEGPLAPISLMDYGEQTAIAMVEGEDSREILSRWLSLETRPNVKQALQRKLEALGDSKRGRRG